MGNGRRKLEEDHVKPLHSLQASLRGLRPTSKYLFRLLLQVDLKECCRSRGTGYKYNLAASLSPERASTKQKQLSEAEELQTSLLGEGNSEGNSAPWQDEGSWMHSTQVSSRKVTTAQAKHTVPPDTETQRVSTTSGKTRAPWETKAGLRGEGKVI